jgi:hypothetical protein
VGVTLPDSGSQAVVVTAVGGSYKLSAILNDIAREQDAQVSFSDGPSPAGGHRGLGEIAIAIAMVAPMVSAVGALLQTILGFAARRGSRLVEITGVDGTTVEVPVSVTPEQFSGYVDEFRRIQAVHVHVDVPTG